MRLSEIKHADQMQNRFWVLEKPTETVLKSVKESICRIYTRLLAVSVDIKFRDFPPDPSSYVSRQIKETK